MGGKKKNNLGVSQDHGEFTVENRTQIPQDSQASAHDSSGTQMFWISVTLAAGGYFIFSVPATVAVVIFVISYPGGKVLYRHFRRNPYHPETFTDEGDRKKQNPNIGAGR